MKVYINLQKSSILLQFLLFAMSRKGTRTKSVFVVKNPGTSKIVDDFLNGILADAAADAASNRTAPHN
jgi:hypothetical protein